MRKLDETLPLGPLGTLFSEYVIFDRCYSFLEKTLSQGSAVPSIDRVNGLISGAGGKAVPLDSLLTIMTMCPTLINIDYVAPSEGIQDPFAIRSGPEGSPLPALTLMFLKHKGPNDKMKEARRSMVLQSLLGNIYDQLRVAIGGKGKRKSADGDSDELISRWKTEASVLDFIKVPAPPPAPTMPSADVKKKARNTLPAVSEALPSSIEAMVEVITTSPYYDNQLVFKKVIESKESTYDETLTLPAPLQLGLSKMGISSLYSHQGRAVRAVMDGSNVVVATSTSSGKSMGYILPTLWRLLQSKVDPSAGTERPVSIFIFPTKALAQDQLRAIKAFIELIPELHDVAIPECHDGDSSFGNREHNRKFANILLSNPDILHCSMLPRHGEWARVLRNLRLIVIDEAHMYKGVFGIHVAGVLRRLVRICRRYGSSPRFMCCTATIANPKDHFLSLVPTTTHGSGEVTTEAGTSVSLEVITEDGSPSGKKTFLLWNPPFIHVGLKSSTKSYQVKNAKKEREKRKEKDKREGAHTSASNAPLPTTDPSKSQIDENMQRRSSIMECALLFATLVMCKYRTLAFSKVRAVSELVSRYAKELLNETSQPQLADLVTSYRAGYSKELRREIEEALFSGKLIGCACTSALELGVDIGTLDATVQLGFPTTIASMWQQAGRAGRGRRESLTVIVAFDSPIDQYFMRNPEHLFDRPMENCVLQFDNVSILRSHLICAAHEFPLHESDMEFFGPSFETALELCLLSSNLNRKADGLVHASTWIVPATPSRAEKVGVKVEKFPSTMSLRSISEIQYDVVIKDSNGVVVTVLDTLDEKLAYMNVYPEAIYLNQNQYFKVVDLCTKTYQSTVTKIKEPNYITRQRDHTDINAQSRIESYKNSHYGRVSVVTKVWGYRKIEKITGNVLAVGEIHVPPIEFESFALWIDMLPSIKDEIEAAGLDFLGGVHSAQHAMLSLVPNFVTCDRTDVGTECPSPYQSRSRPLRVIIYETHPGGLGLSEYIFKSAKSLVIAAKSLVSGCRCEKGCPSCIQDLLCTEHNFVNDKRAALMILGHLIDLL